MPIITKRKGRYREHSVDVARLAVALGDAVVEYGVKHVGLEAVHSSPQMGVVSAFSFGRTFGEISAVCRLCGPALHLVSPAVWKARMLVKGEKKNSVFAAQKLFGVSPWFMLISKDGRAEAALLARYVSKDLIGEDDEDPLS